MRSKWSVRAQGPSNSGIVVAAGLAMSISSVSVGGPSLIESRWVNPVNGAWQTPANWSTPQAPNNGVGQQYHAIIDAGTATPYTVSIGSGSVTVSQLTLDSAGATLHLFGDSTFRPFGATIASGKLRLENTTLLDSTMNVLETGTLSVKAGRLRNVQVNGVVDMELNGNLWIEGSTHIDTIRTLAPDSDILFLPGYQINGLLDIQQPAALRMIGAPGSLLTLGATGVIRRSGGGPMTVTDSIAFVNNGLIETMQAGNEIRFDTRSFANHGLVQSNGGSLQLTPETFIQTGVIRAAGGTLSITPDAAWTNSGLIEATSAGAVVLGGTLDARNGFGTIRGVDGGVMRLAGTLLNDGHQFVLDESTGVWTLSGWIQGGSFKVEEGGGYVIQDAVGFHDVEVLDAIHASQGDVRLRGGTRFPELTLSNTRDALIEQEFTLRDTLTVTGSNVAVSEIRSNSGSTQFTIDAGGVLQTAAGASSRIYLRQSVLTVNNGLIWNRSAPSTIELASNSLVNNGEIVADAGRIYIGATTSTSVNNGVYRANQAELWLRGDWSNANGLVELNHSSLILDGAFSTADIGAIHATESVVDIRGALNNGGQTFVLTDDLGPVQVTGSITGGAVAYDQGSIMTLGATQTGRLIDVQVQGDLMIRRGRLEGDTRFDTALLSGGGAIVTFGTGYVLKDRIAIAPENTDDVSVSLATTSTIDAGGVIDIDRAIMASIEGGVTIVNHGEVHARAGAQLELQTQTLSNHGVVSADAAILDLDLTSLDNTGLIRAANGAVANIVADSSIQNSGLIEVLGGSSLTLEGQLDNAAGMIRVTDSTLTLSTPFELNGLGSLELSNAVVRVNANLDLMGGVLDVSPEPGVLWTLQGASQNAPVTVSNGSIVSSHGAPLFNEGSTSKLDNVSIHTSIDIAAGILTLTGSTNLPENVIMRAGTLLLQDGAVIESVIAGAGDAAATRTVRAAGALRIGSEGHVVLSDGVSGGFTLGSSVSRGLVVNEGEVSLGADNELSRVFATTLSNAGTLQASSGVLLLDATNVVNTGAIHTSDATLHLDIAGSLENHGSIFVENGALIFDVGSYAGTSRVSVADSLIEVRGNVASNVLLQIDTTNCDVELTGSINNAGATLVASEEHQRWKIRGGSVIGGSFEVDGAALRATSEGGLLQNVLIGGELALDADGARADLLGSTRYDRAVISGEDTALRFGGNRTIFGETLVSGAGLKSISLTTPGSLTIDSDAIVSLSGKAAYIQLLFTENGAGMTLINKGTMLVDAPNGEILVNVAGFANEGDAIAQRGSLRFSGFDMQNTGRLAADGGQIVIATDEGWQNDGELSASRGGSLTVFSDLTQSESARITIELAGAESPRQGGAILITGHTALDGALAVNLSKSASTYWGAEWSIIEFGSSSGDFSDFLFPVLDNPDLVWWTQSSGTSYEVGVRHIADLDHDGLIGFSDLNSIVSNFNTFGSALEGDVNGDGFIGFADLNIVTGLFNTIAPRAVPAPGAAALAALTLLARSRRRR